MSLRRKAKYTHLQINEILFRNWNPIGAEGLPLDEYEGYVGSIYRALAEDATETELAELLRSIEWQEMGIYTTEPHRIEVARKLLTLTKNDEVFR